MRGHAPPGAAVQPEGNAAAGREKQKCKNTAPGPRRAGLGRGNLFRWAPHILPVGSHPGGRAEDLPQYEKADQKKRQNACTAQRGPVERERVRALAEAVEEG